MRSNVSLSHGTECLSTAQKALQINLDPSRYGTFAEIGAGQEVVRWFFKVGGAAGTIAKSISAYDMKVSDAIYGTAQRYVSRARLEAMLDHEQRLNLARLQDAAAPKRAFFTLANTVAAKSYRGKGACHGWMGVRYQRQPGEAHSQILLHVEMLDAQAVLQQEALGVLGVNLLHGALHLADDLDAFVVSLLHNLSSQRLEIDMIAFSGEAFQHTDNRLMSLKLVQHGLSHAAMFSPRGEVLQPSEVLYHKPVMVLRGSFRPPTRVHACMQRCALRQLAKRAQAPEPVVSLMEITMRNLMDDGPVATQDFLDRAEILSALDKTVLISNYSEHYRLAHYLSRRTNKPIGLTLGAATLLHLFDERYYTQLDGGILEGFGRLFKSGVTLYVYPMLSATGQVVTAHNLPVPSSLIHLYQHLLQRGCIEALDNYDPDVLPIDSRAVLAQIRRGDPRWEASVPALVAQHIKAKGLFGYPG